MKNLFINVATNEKNPNWEKSIARQEPIRKKENDVRSEFDRSTKPKYFSLQTMIIFAQELSM